MKYKLHTTTELDELYGYKERTITGQLEDKLDHTIVWKKLFPKITTNNPFIYKKNKPDREQLYHKIKLHHMNELDRQFYEVLFPFDGYKIYMRDLQNSSSLEDGFALEIFE